jgi:hypothetical protein
LEVKDHKKGTGKESLGRNRDREPIVTVHLEGCHPMKDVLGGKTGMDARLHSRRNSCNPGLKEGFAQGLLMKN